jgi:hypothetical protein
MIVLGADTHERSPQSPRSLRAPVNYSTRTACRSALAGSQTRWSVSPATTIRPVPLDRHRASVVEAAEVRRGPAACAERRIETAVGQVAEDAEDRLERPSMMPPAATIGPSGCTAAASAPLRQEVGAARAHLERADPAGSRKRGVEVARRRRGQHDPDATSSFRRGRLQDAQDQQQDERQYRRDEQGAQASQAVREEQEQGDGLRAVIGEPAGIPSGTPVDTASAGVSDPPAVGMRSSPWRGTPRGWPPPRRSPARPPAAPLRSHGAARAAWPPAIGP